MISLPRAAGAGYQLMTTHFFDGEGLVCQPFQLDVSFDSQPDFKRSILFAEQSDNVVIAQTPSVIYVFYSELALTDFGAWIADTRQAKPLLCDINLPLCISEQKRLIDAGTKMQRVCGSRVRR